MADAHKYLVPEYYSGFSCKGGSCRSTCCSGWGISFSMEEYFRLLGLTCPPDLRRKLDGAFHMVEHPTQERYAQITPNWLGKCPLHMENGLCQLHAECGEAALTSVCRMYPRGVHTEFERECSCANSCERVLEILFEMKEPMRFKENELHFDLPEADEETDPLAIRWYRPIRRRIIGALQDRSFDLPSRLALVGGMIRLLNEAFRNQEDWIVSGALEVCGQMKPPAMPEPDQEFSMLVMYRLTRMFSRNISVEGYIGETMMRLGLSVDEEPEDMQIAAATRKYEADAAEFDRKVPDWMLKFEQLMVNHVFFDRFPFSDRHESLWEDYISLCAGYAFARFMAVEGMAERDGEEALIDILASVFRLIEHSGFDLNAASLLEARGISSLEDLARLVQI